jgi:ferric-dicitrate binding protein FerR (iron transport regulator)
MNSSNKEDTNNVYLAKWINDELTDNEFISIVGKKDFKVYLKIKNGLDYFEAPYFDKDNLKGEILKKIKKPQKISKINSSKLWYAVAASIALIISIYLMNFDNKINITTKIGEKQMAYLLDGSEVTLNANSNIYYDKKSWNDHKEIILEGEAFFRVVKKGSFVVKTKNGIVKVIGTQFNINSKNNFFNVKCFEGKVLIIKNNDSVYITKGMVYQNHNQNSEQWNIDQNSPSWLVGESTFKEVSLQIVMESLKSQFDINFNSNNIDLDQLYTGSFTNNNLEIALKSVFIPMEIDYKLKNKTVFLNKK